MITNANEIDFEKFIKLQVILKTTLLHKYVYVLIQDEIEAIKEPDELISETIIFREIFGYLNVNYIDDFPPNFYEQNKRNIDSLYWHFKGKLITLSLKKILDRFQKITESDQQKNYEHNKIRRAILEKERKKQLQNEIYKKLVDEGHIKRPFFDSNSRREQIPQDIMDQVWNRDSGRCVKCGSKENLEFDHIIPHSKGGANSYRNLQILCKICNIEKSNKIG